MIVQPNVVVLPGRQWVAELEAELTALGVDQPHRAAVRAIQHVCARAGWPRECFTVDEAVLMDGELARVQAEEPART